MKYALRILASVGLLSLVSFVPAARADLIFTASLQPGTEVPPLDTPAFGFITVDLHTDLNTLDVIESFGDLSVPASAAHIHCCTQPGSNAPVVLPFSNFPLSTSGEYTHTFNLATDLAGISVETFLAGLQSGQAYANIHNSSFPGGEVRGLLEEVPESVPEPSTFVMVGGCLVAVGLFRRRIV
jgi:hypothetical protein